MILMRSKDNRKTSFAFTGVGIVSQQVKKGCHPLLAASSMWQMGAVAAICLACHFYIERGIISGKQGKRFTFCISLVGGCSPQAP